HNCVKDDEGNWDDLFDIYMIIHRYVVSICGNSRSIKIYNSIQVQIRTYHEHLDRYYSNHQSFYEEHQDLLQALLTKNSQTVKASVRNHIEYVEEKLLGVYQ